MRQACTCSRACSLDHLHVCLPCACCHSCGAHRPVLTASVQGCGVSSLPCHPHQRCGSLPEGLQFQNQHCKSGGKAFTLTHLWPHMLPGWLQCQQPSRRLTQGCISLSSQHSRIWGLGPVRMNRPLRACTAGCRLSNLCAGHCHWGTIFLLLPHFRHLANDFQVLHKDLLVDWLIHACNHSLLCQPDRCTADCRAGSNPMCQQTTCMHCKVQ